MKVKNSVVFFTLMLAVLTVMPGVSNASDPQATVRGIHVAVGGGGSFNVYGIGEELSPAAQLGAGYRWSILEINVDFLWNSIESKLKIGDGCIGPFSGVGRCADHLDGHHLGGIIHGRAYLFGSNPKINPYATLGLGFRALLYETEELQGAGINWEFVKKSGSIWGLVVRAGIGLELEIYSGVFIDLAAVYDLTEYEEMIDSEDGTTQSINLVGMVKFSF